VRRLENLVRAVFELEPDTAREAPSAPARPLTEDDLRAEVAMINAGM
jgi:hypothetical protein